MPETRQPAQKFRKPPLYTPPWTFVTHEPLGEPPAADGRLPSAATQAAHPGVSPLGGAFWNRAYKENITGLAGMVAYNLMLAIFPFALLVLFVFGQVVNSPETSSAA